MTDRFTLGAGIALALGLLAAAPAADAISLKDCSAKYQAAKKDGSLGTRTWTEYRKVDCGDAGLATANTASTQSAAAAPASSSTTAPAVTATAKPAPAATSAASAASAAAPADLPSVIDPKYAAEKPARARLHACSDSYRAHKKAGTLNGLKWLQKGGGFYSLCNRKLKAAG